MTLTYVPKGRYCRISPISQEAHELVDVYGSYWVIVENPVDDRFMFLLKPAGTRGDEPVWLEKGADFRFVPDTRFKPKK